MQEYLGICLVAVVIGIVVTLMARFITGGILSEIEKVKRRRAERNLGIFIKVSEQLVKVLGEMAGKILESDEKKSTRRTTTKKKPYNSSEFEEE